MKVRYAFKHTAAAPGAVFYTFKHTLHRLYRLCCGDFEKCQKSVLTKLTKPTILEALSSAVAYVEFDPVLLAGFFLGAISAIFSTVISALGFSGSSPQ